MRIGLVADTHMPGTIQELWPELKAAMAGVDLILHAGDLHTVDVIDRFEALAPCCAARGNGDRGLVDERLRDTWVLDFDGVRVGMIHILPNPATRPAENVMAYCDRHFRGADLDVLVYGHNHLEAIHSVGPLMCINPGSPTLPRNQSLRLGTIGLLEIGAGAVIGSICQLQASGLETLAEATLYPASDRASASN